MCFPLLSFQQRDEQFLGGDFDNHVNKNLPAIYTHCFDETGTRLFAAGGPLQSSIVGNYMSLYQ